MLVPGGGVKIERSEVQALMLAASASTFNNASLRRLADQVRKQPFVFAH